MAEHEGVDGARRRWLGSTMLYLMLPVGVFGTCVSISFKMVNRWLGAAENGHTCDLGPLSISSLSCLR